MLIGGQYYTFIVFCIDLSLNFGSEIPTTNRKRQQQRKFQNESGCKTLDSRRTSLNIIKAFNCGSKVRGMTTLFMWPDRRYKPKARELDFNLALSFLVTAKTTKQQQHIDDGYSFVFLVIYLFLSYIFKNLAIGTRHSCLETYADYFERQFWQFLMRFQFLLSILSIERVLAQDFWRDFKEGSEINRARLQFCKRYGLI